MVLYSFRSFDIQLVSRNLLKGVVECDFLLCSVEFFLLWRIDILGEQLACFVASLASLSQCYFGGVSEAEIGALLSQWMIVVEDPCLGSYWFYSKRQAVAIR